MRGKPELVGFRCTRAEKTAVEKTAKEQHMYPSSWVRKVVADKIEELNEKKPRGK